MKTQMNGNWTTKKLLKTLNCTQGYLAKELNLPIAKIGYWHRNLEGKIPAEWQERVQNLVNLEIKPETKPNNNLNNPPVNAPVVMPTPEKNMNTTNVYIINTNVAELPAIVNGLSRS